MRKRDLRLNNNKMGGEKLFGAFFFFFAFFFFYLQQIPRDFQIAHAGDQGPGVDKGRVPRISFSCHAIQQASNAPGVAVDSDAPMRHHRRGGQGVHDRTIDACVVGKRNGSVVSVDSVDSLQV